MIIIEYAYQSAVPKRLEFESELIMIGRPSGDWIVDLDLSPDTTVSRRHARLIYQNGNCWIEDVTSRGGTWVNGKKIVARTKIEPGDSIRIGRTDLSIYIDAAPPLPEDANVFDTQPAPDEPEDQTLKEGMFTSTVSANESPSTLLMVKKIG